jgi:hypothetical protein
MTMSPDAALRGTRLALVGLIGAIVVTLGAPFIPLDDDTPEPRPADPTQFNTTQRAQSDVLVQADRWSQLYPLLQAIHEVEEQQVAQTTANNPQNNTGAGGASPTAQISRLNGWRYIGSVQLDQTRFAVVSINGKQRYLAQGDSVQEISINSISENEIILQLENDTHTIKRANRPAPTMRAAPPTQGRPNNANPGNQPTVPGQNTPLRDQRSQQEAP